MFLFAPGGKPGGGSGGGNTPNRETRPYVGLSPTTPQHADGTRMEPPVSVPKLPKQRPAAVATPEPLDETPVQREGSQGLMGAATLG